MIGLKSDINRIFFFQKLEFFVRAGLFKFCNNLLVRSLGKQTYDDDHQDGYQEGREKLIQAENAA